MKLIDPKPLGESRNIIVSKRQRIDPIQIFLYRLYFVDYTYITINFISYYIDQFSKNILTTAISRIHIFCLIISKDKDRRRPPFDEARDSQKRY